MLIIKNSKELAELVDKNKDLSVDMEEKKTLKDYQLVKFLTK